MTFEKVILFIALLLCLGMVKKAILRFHQTHALDITVKEFIETYYKYQDVWNTDYDVEQILRICKKESNVFQIGVIKEICFQNAKELRRYMLKTGEFIIKHSEILQDQYGHVWDEDEYNTSLEILKEIRGICIQKGEKATIQIKIN